MAKMPGHPRLYRRGATYYHRAAIPVDIRDSYPKTEETYSLRTKDYQEALKRVRVEAVKVDQRFEAHRRRLALQGRPALRELSDGQIRQIADLYYAFRLEEDEELRLSGFYDPSDQQPPEPLPSFDEYGELTEDLDAANKQNYARGQLDPFFEAEVDEVLGWDGVNLRLESQSPSRKALARALQAASIRAAKAIRERNAGEVIETPSAAGIETQTAGPLLSSAVEEWASEKARTRWVEKTEREHRVWTTHFISVAGDRPLSSYGKADARAFKSILLKLPANWSKFEVLSGLPISRAAEKAAELGLAPMSDNNVNKLLGFVGSFWTWAEENYDDAPPNPFRGVKIKTRRHAREERDPFSVSELDAIFKAPLFTGCRSLHFWKQPGDLIPRDSGFYWVPLIALFSGARLGEIIQLYASDIREEDGVPFFDINNDGQDKRLKNPNAKRAIPVHPKLIEFGLLDLVDTRRSQNECRLFPDLKMGEDGYYSSPFSKFFSRFLASVGVKQRKNAFHSFRHSFEDACRNNGVSKEVMDALQGHGESGMSARYGRGFELTVKSEAVRKVRYARLDLSHLVLPSSGYLAEKK